MRAPSSASWHLFGVLLRPRWGRVGALAGVLSAGSALPLAGPQIVRAFIDAAVAGRPSAALAVLAGAYVAVALAGQAMTVAATYWAGRLAWSAADELRARLAGHALSLDLGFHGAHRPGELIERVDGDVTKLAEFLSSFAVRVVGSALTLAGMLAIVAFIDWRVALGLALFLAMAATVVARQREAAAPQAVERRAATAELLGVVEERLAAAEDLRANGGGPFAMRGLDAAAAKLYRAAVRAERGATNVFVTSAGVFTLGGVASLAAGAWLYSTGTVTLGTVFLLLQYTALLRRPLELIADQLQRVQEAVAGVSRAAELLRLPLPATGGGSGRLPAGPLAVELDAVGFAYDPAGEPALRAISLRLAPGQVLGVVGRTGSGKTTMGRLLARLADPTSGTVSVGGVALRSARVEDVRARIGLVPQDVHLFTASLRDNLTLFGAHPAADAELAGALDGLGLGRWWRGLPDGLDTVLASAGTGTSAGEAQLVAFARVFLRDPGLVVLDEPSSRIDPVTQVQVQRAMDHLLAGRTAVVIAHRLRTLDRADQVLVLEEGRVVEHGRRPVLAIDPSTRFARLLGAERRDGHDGRGGREPAGTTGRPL